MYKIINNLVDTPSHTLLIPADGRTRRTTVYRVIYTQIDAYKYSLLSAYHRREQFAYRGMSIQQKSVVLLPARSVLMT
jgi:hypothetical protein